MDNDGMNQRTNEPTKANQQTNRPTNQPTNEQTNEPKSDEDRAAAGSLRLSWFARRLGGTAPTESVGGTATNKWRIDNGFVMVNAFSIGQSCQ